MPGEAPLDARTVRASRLQPVSSSSHPEPATRRRQDADRDSQERILTPQHPEPATTRRPNDDRSSQERIEPPPHEPPEPATTRRKSDDRKSQERTEKPATPQHPDLRQRVDRATTESRRF